MEFDYKKLGFKSGLEIHQQLDTHKLFCSCPSVLRSDEPDFTIKRNLHAVAGESGKVDEAAKYQASMNKDFIYQGYNDTTCLVELDEEPPHEINPEALKIALQVATLLNCQILPVAQIMRKTVIDGSNTSGFQRTVLIGINGFVETSFGKVSIDNLFLEEDAARPSGKKDDYLEEIGMENSKVYKLDRLGIPLLEIATGPHMYSAEQVKEAALKIGEILRSCKVKRGIGTIRQDVNVSISKGARVEIKGFQDPKMMIETVNQEIQRQLDLINSKKKVISEVRNALPDGKTEFLRPMPGSHRMYPETDLPLLKISRDLINEVKKNLPKLKTVIEDELKNKGLSQEMIKLIFSEGMLDEFEALLKLYNNPNFIVKALILWPKEISSKEKLSDKKISERLSVDLIESVVHEVVKGKIKENDVKNVLGELATGKSLSDALKMKSAEVDMGEVEEKIHKIIKEKPGLNANAYMGLVMAQMKGLVDGKTAMDVIRKFVE